MVVDVMAAAPVILWRRPRGEMDISFRDLSFGEGASPEGEDEEGETSWLGDAREKVWTGYAAKTSHPLVCKVRCTKGEVSSKDIGLDICALV